MTLTLEQIKQKALVRIVDDDAELAEALRFFFGNRRLAGGGVHARERVFRSRRSVQTRLRASRRAHA